MKNSIIFLFFLIVFFQKNNPMGELRESMMFSSLLNFKHAMKMNSSLTIITGPMFAGKTSKMIEMLEEIITQKNTKILSYKHGADNRYDEKNDTTEGNIKSHDGKIFPCALIKDPVEILHLLRKNSHSETIEDKICVAVDEVQFFDSSVMIKVVKKLLERDCKVILSGLDLDFLCNPFGPILELTKSADKVIRLTAICARCKSGKAIYSKRIIESNALIAIGGAESYQPSCEACFDEEWNNLK